MVWEGRIELQQLHVALVTRKVGAGKLTLVDVRGVGLLPGLGALLLVARGSGRLLASLLLLGGCLTGRGLAAGGGCLLGFGRHFG